MTSTSTRYSKPMLIFHWATPALVLLAYLTSEGGASVRTDPPTTHIVLGLSVLFLTLPRLLLRYLRGVPRAPESAAPRIVRVARLGHGLIYYLLLAVPVTGWFPMSSLGLNIKNFGWQLPLLVPSVQGDPGIIANLHQLGGNLMLILAGLHAGIALWHYFWLRDGILQRMSPF